MTRTIEIDHTLKPIKYAWPGGYPVYYLAERGWRDIETGILDWAHHNREIDTCCASCASKASEYDLILIGQEANYEDTELYCDVCNERIESAYAEDERSQENS